MKRPCKAEGLPEPCSTMLDLSLRSSRIATIRLERPDTGCRLAAHAAGQRVPAEGRGCTRALARAAHGGPPAGQRDPLPARPAQARSEGRSGADPRAADE